MTNSIVIHLSRDIDGTYICTDSICEARGDAPSPEAAINAWAADVFHGHRFLLEHRDKLSPELMSMLSNVERVFFPSPDEDAD